jgi:beta-lactamase class A
MKKKVGVALSVLSLLLGAAVAWTIQKFISDDSNFNKDIHCVYEFSRMDGYEHIKPLQYVEAECEREDYIDLKIQLENKIDSLQKAGIITSASVYLRDFEIGGWISVSPEKRYHPGSLLKLGVLFCILKQAENDSSLLSRSIEYQPGSEFIPTQTFCQKSIEKGKRYRIQELLEYMIAYSDNNATAVLNKIMNYKEYLNIFKTLNLEEPDGSNPNYSVAAKDFSNFFKVLYNGSYLSPKMSEKAIQLMLKCDFKGGMMEGLPSSTPVAHKFGEWSGSADLHELHEAGIIYMGNKAYLLTIMTSGKEIEKIRSTIPLLTRETHHFLRKFPRQIS